MLFVPSVIRVRLEAHMLLPVNKNADVFRNHITEGLSILPSDEIALAIASRKSTRAEA
jgi:hypothetical protein